MGSLPTIDLHAINPFDAAVYICLFVAVVMGFLSGLLRSLATIFGYVAAMGVAVALAPRLTPLLSGQFKLAPGHAWIAFAAIFLVAGILLSALLRYAVKEMVGERISIPDRLAGALLGAARVGLLAVVLVLVFDRIIPPGYDPAFLQGSKWRPVLSKAGQQGLRSLPPEVAATIDRIKRERGL
jgi:membrane protein required for colicin V production